LSVLRAKIQYQNTLSVNINCHANIILGGLKTTKPANAGFVLANKRNESINDHPLGSSVLLW
jgi:hypothetical protein